VLAELKQQGLIRQIGLSNVSPEQLAAKVKPYITEALRTEFYTVAQRTR